VAYINLGSLYLAVSKSLGRSFPGGGQQLIPDADRISIPVSIWLDASKRLVRLTADEPLYTAFYQGKGGTVGGTQVNATGCLSPNPCGVRQLVQHNYLTFTVNLYDFGAPAHITAPPPARIAHLTG
jgi:hypothetical protein